VAEAPYAENEVVEPVDLSRIPWLRSTEH